MPRHYIEPFLSFRYPDVCGVREVSGGRAYELTLPDMDHDRESYLVKWIDTKAPKLAWEWLSNSPFDKKADLRPVEKDIKVAGFKLRRLPELTKLVLAPGQYASFRGSEYDKAYDGTEWVELTWCRMFAHEVGGKLKILGMSFVASGEATQVAGRVRDHFMNLHGGFLYEVEGAGEWSRVEFPVETRPVQPAPATPTAAPRQAVPESPTGTPRSSSRAGYVPETTQCGWCSGSGRQVCSSCNGSGGRNESYTTWDWEGHPQYNTQWISCSCSGGYSSCSSCGGRGYAHK